MTSDLLTGSLCSGYGGLDLAAAAVLGGSLAWVADPDPGAAAALACRYPAVPNLGDITAADWAAVRPVGVLTAGFPCQDVSCAGRRAGLRAGNRTGLWHHIAAAIRALRPGLVFLENVGGLLSEYADSDVEPCPWCLGDTTAEHAVRALGAVLADLAEAGLHARWCSLRASDVGACHRRERVFILAWPAAADPGRLRGQPRRLPAPGQAAPGGPLAVPGLRSRTRAAADPQGDRRHERRPQPARIIGRPDAALCGDGSPAAPASDQGRVSDRDHGVAWGRYEPAIRRWEAVTGRPAPCPTEPGRSGERLSPAFAEWMMGLPAGWVTAVPGLTRNQRLRLLGNGVVPRQAAAALTVLLADAGAGTARSAA